MEKFVEVNLKHTRLINSDQNLSDADEWVEAVCLGEWDDGIDKVMLVHGEYRGHEATCPGWECRLSIPGLLKEIKGKVQELQFFLNQNADRIRARTTIPLDKLLTLLDQVKEAKEL